MNKYKIYHAPSSETVDGQNTAESETTSNQVSSTDTDSNQSEQTQDVKTFTQKQVDKILNKRIKEVESKYSDYETLKADVEKLKQMTQEVTQQAKTAEEKLKETKQTTSIELAAKEVNFPIELANKLLDPKEYIVAEDGTITNVKELLTKLISLYPQLVKKPTPDTPTVNNLNELTPSKKFTLHPGKGSKFFEGSGLIKN